MSRGCVAAILGSLLCCAGAQAQEAYFTRYVSFGDSLSDNGRILRETGFTNTTYLNTLFGSPIYVDGQSANRPAFVEALPSLIGLPYRSADGYAIGGSRVIHLDADPAYSPNFAWGLPDQIDQAAARIGRFGPRDLINLWIGYNDITPVAFGTTAEKAQAVATIVGGTTNAIGRLAALGAREFVVFNQKTDRAAELQIPGIGAIPFGGKDVAVAVNGALPAALAPLSASGLNIHYFDVDALISRLRADPTAFGYGSDANTPCLLVPSCRAVGASDGGATLDQYISPEGIHNTGRTNRYIAAFLANQLNAPTAIGPQVDLGEAAGRAFSAGLLDRLDAERRRNRLSVVPGQYAADLPTRKPPTNIPVQFGSPLSLFALGTYAALDRNVQQSGQGSIGNRFGADFAGFTAGLQYQAAPEFVLGAAFNYLNTSVDLRGLSNGRVDLDSLQGGVFASYNGSNAFLDAAVTYGTNRYDLSRPGVLNDRLTAAPNGNTLTAAARAGYLFDLTGLRLGPIAELAYANTQVGAYREQGDPLLTIGVRRQSLDGLSVGGGVQVRTDLPLANGLVSPFLNLTAQHDVLTGVRTVSSFQTYAPVLLIRTQTGRHGDDVYGRATGGLDIDLGNGLSGLLSGSASFARAGGNDRTLQAGLQYRF
jgi:outer membrane lipase/esterase